MDQNPKFKCDGCYQGFQGRWWCDNCDQWPCICEFGIVIEEVEETDGRT